VCAPYFMNFNNNTFQLKTLLFFVHSRSQQKRTKKVISNCQIYTVPFWHCEICRVERCVWGWFSWLYTRSSTASTFSAVRVVRGTSTIGARSVDHVVRNRLRKSSTPRLLHFLFENFLINRLTPYFFDSQTCFINILSSFVNILSF